MKTGNMRTVRLQVQELAEAGLIREADKDRYIEKYIRELFIEACRQSA